MPLREKIRDQIPEDRFNSIFKKDDIRVEKEAELNVKLAKNDIEKALKFHNVDLVFNGATQRIEVVDPSKFCRKVIEK
jgi:hypothetical protein